MNPAVRPVTIGVAGGTGSGKTTVANALLEAVGRDQIAYLVHDAYYKDIDDLGVGQPGSVNFDHPDALDNDLLAAHIQQLQAWQPVAVPLYDFHHNKRLPETQRVLPRLVILVEGILILALPALRSLFDIKIFVDADADVRLIRRLQRDVAERGRTVDTVITQYMTTVRPMHLEFVEPSKRYANVIIPQGGHNRVAVDMVADRIRSMMAQAAESTPRR